MAKPQISELNEFLPYLSCRLPRIPEARCEQLISRHVEQSNRWVLDLKARFSVGYHDSGFNFSGVNEAAIQFLITASWDMAALGGLRYVK